MRKRGRPVLGAISGFFLGLLLGIDLLLFSVIALDSILLLVLPILGLVVGIALPLIMRRRAAAQPQEMREPALDEYVPPPPPEAAPETPEEPAPSP